MQWRDLADVVTKTNPDATPARGVCWISDDNMWMVARVDTRDPSKGWAVWMGRRPIGDHLFFASDDVAKVFARIVSMPVRGLARVLRVAARGRRFVLDAAALVAKMRRVVVAETTAAEARDLQLAATFKAGERAVDSEGRLLERVDTHHFAKPEGQLAFRCLRTTARWETDPSAIVPVAPGALMRPSNLRLLRDELVSGGRVCVAGTTLEVVRVAHRARAEGLLAEVAAQRPDWPRAVREFAATYRAPQLTAADVTAALEYAIKNPEEMAFDEASIRKSGVPLGCEDAEETA